MEDEGSSRTAGRPGKEPMSRRRVWSPEEESALLNALRGIVVGGWRCENGFCTGYLKALEKSMRKTFPETDLRAQPHIDSKIHVWRKHCASLTSMLSRSGFGWNSTKNMVEVENKQIWDDYVRTDNHAKGMYNKSYPMYDAWQEIFGKERATGENAEDLGAADRAPLRCTREEIHVDDSPVGGDDMVDTNSENQTVCGPTAVPPMQRCAGKKRKNRDSEEADVVGLMGRFCDQVEKRLGEISSRIGYEFKLAEKRAELYSALGVLGVLNPTEQIYIHKKLCSNNQDLEAFFNLPHEARAQMVRMMCDGQI